ncbi:succinate--hydroxymethylglutarate CoA-transferase isoform X3 [Fundulus heteroclitus]|uniref:succinate--hydroxymethylglutarate CoA-transferase isoform X3 n=1 Tax=Fundulus heteroclitus TaxID=8078 RepID=UPI00165B2AB3|nr:succinate--hydroxymethylglutarate CoA-transferase isoform X3 [Fundulus heteroclitus]
MSGTFRVLNSFLWARYRSGSRVLLQGNRALRCPGCRQWSSDTNTAAGAPRPLEGVRVLDLTRVLAGPFATMILGDLGAEVIKVERPGGGDDTRAWGPPFVASESVYFLSINRNKKSIAVDMKHARGAEIIQQLAAVSDVLVENFLPGKLPQMGLGYAELSRVNPRLVYCSISGYGQTGPQCQSPGYDSIASAVSGMMHITGPEDGEPVRPGVAMTDLATGLYAHGAIMAALLQRHKTGRGVHIDCNLLSSQVSCISHIAANYLNAGKEAKRWGTAHESIVPYQGFRTKDGHLVVAAGNNKQFVRVCQVLDLQNLTEDPKYRTNQLRVQNRKQLLQTLSQRFLQETTADWLRRFQGSGVPVGPINSIQEVFSEPQVKTSAVPSGVLPAGLAADPAGPDAAVVLPELRRGRLLPHRQVRPLPVRPVLLRRPGSPGPEAAGPRRREPQRRELEHDEEEGL